MVDHEAVELLERVDLCGVFLPVGDEGVIDVIPVAGGHIGKLEKRDPIAVGDSVDVFVDGVVESQGALVCQLQNKRHGIGLGDAADGPGHVCGDGDVTVDVSETSGGRPRALARNPDACHCARHVVLGHDLLQGALQLALKRGGQLSLRSGGPGHCGAARPGGPVRRGRGASAE